MKTPLSLLTAVLISNLLPAQGGPIEARLMPTRSIVAPTGKLECNLEVHIKEDADIEKSVLSGANLQIYLGEKPLPGLEQKVSGKVKMVAGTKLMRTFSLDMERVIAGIPTDDLITLNLRWPDLPGASTEVRVIPNQSSLDVDAMDLAATKVRLVTNYGDVVLKFRPDKAPNHVRNFLKLSKDGFYNGTKFHRVIKGFMVQGGCPNTKDGAEGIPGSGNPGYAIDAEFNDTQHVRGIVSMARSNSPNSAGCQFFICHGRASHLDGQYSAFGEVDTGLDVVDAIAGVRVAGRQGSTPVEPVHLYAAIVLPVMK
ncbi:MAG: peptidylprolyl isomerase [Planctomycetota bacterium]|jgi:peptidyl-prolyl cis-trans isomerase B (cyclophilin B)